MLEFHSDSAFWVQDSLVLVEGPTCGATFPNEFSVGSVRVVLEEREDSILHSHLTHAVQELGRMAIWLLRLVRKTPKKGSLSSLRQLQIVS